MITDSFVIRGVPTTNAEVPSAELMFLKGEVKFGKHFEEALKKVYRKQIKNRRRWG